MKIIKAVHNLNAQAAAAQIGYPLPSITSDNWAQIKADLGAAAARLEQLFTIDIWLQMRQRNDTQYIFVGQYEQAQQAPRAVSIAPPKSNCCNK